MKSKLFFFRYASLISLVVLLFLVLYWIGTRSKAGDDLTGIAVGENTYHPGTALPKTTVHLWPDPAIADFALYGSAPYSDPEGDFEGIGTYRWLRNGTLLESGFVPQSLLLPMDGSLLSTDGQSPVQSSGLNFVPGRFGGAVHTSLLADSKIAYPSYENVSPNEGSIEMWVQLSQDLVKLGNAKYHPRLFSYTIDSERQLYVEINSGRIAVASRYLGQVLSTWPNPPNWHADEWHLITATWSAIAKRQAIYYDCVLQDEAEFPILNGSASEFYLGSDENVAAIDGNIDDVRLSRRALSAEEVAAACRRPGPAPKNEVILPANQLRAGDQITYEFTPCDINGSCDLTASTNTFVMSPPLGPLEPSPGILSEDTITYTLVLTTQVLAECRWSEKTETPYSEMPNLFEQGQGTTHHSTIISRLPDEVEVHLYVRCADLASGRDPDAYQRSTFFRIQKPWATVYPLIANISGATAPQLDEAYLTAFEVSMLDSSNATPRLANYLHRENPSGKIFLTINTAFGQAQTDPLTADWLNSLPGDPGHNCLMRDSLGGILKRAGFDTPIYNLTVPYCRSQLLQYSLAAFGPNHPGQGEVVLYDGIYFADLNSSISWASNFIDSDLDGKADDPDTLDAAYKAGVNDFLAQMRENLPHAVLVGNTSDPALSPWLNGSVFDWQINALSDGSENTPQWNEISVDLLAPTSAGDHPRVNFIRSSPDLIDHQKYSSLDQIPPAIVAEAATGYERMRFGLITALMGNSLYSYDLGWSEPGPTWWYDEYGSNPGPAAGHTRLPPPGYLGQPVGDPSLLVDHQDDSGLQAGSNGIWTRLFTNGLALVNTTSKEQIVPLPSTYCKLDGNQAPLFQVRMDDEAAIASPGWTARPADLNQIGETVMEAQGGSFATLDYVPHLAYPGVYEVLVWIAPAEDQSPSVELTIHHADGDARISIDETTSRVGWYSLGFYSFDAGSEGRVQLSATGSGKVVGDAVKWVSAARYNDGKQVDRIILQPYDGIILLSSCYQPELLDFLPLVVR